MTFLLGMLVSVLFHECAHATVARSLGFKVNKVGLTWKGPYVKIERQEQDKWNLVWLIALAGPVSNLFLAAYFYAFDRPLLAVFNLTFALVNLIPFWGSDGAFILRRLRDRGADS